MVRHVNEAGTTCSVPSLAYASGYLTGASVVENEKAAVVESSSRKRRDVLGATLRRLRSDPSHPFPIVKHLAALSIPPSALLFSARAVYARNVAVAVTL